MVEAGSAQPSGPAATPGCGSASDLPAADALPFMAIQYRLAAHLRDPERCPAPAGLEDRRLAIYRDLVFNNVESLLADNFPVLRTLLPDGHWKAMVRDFLVRHRARTPLFLELGQEFLEYLHKERGDAAADPPFLLELAHYEWVELALRIAPDALPACDPHGDLLAGHPLISPLVRCLTYRFPVHRIGPALAPREPPPAPTRLLVYRNPADRVEFMEINAVTQRLIELLQGDRRHSGRAALTHIASELAHPQPELVLDFGARLLADLHARGVVLGTGPAAD